jgi:HEAT repeat protein
LNVRGAIEVLLVRLAEDSCVSLEDKTLLDKAQRIRNAAVHARRPPDPQRVDNMIDTIERICCRWVKPL